MTASLKSNPTTQILQKQERRSIRKSHLEIHHGRTIRELHSLESKMLNLQTRYQHLLKQRQEDIAFLITNLDLASLEDTTLVGGLLFLKGKIGDQDPMVEGWRNTGERFLRRTKSQKVKSFQTSPKNHALSQPTQKQSESKEK
ncbi:MAG: hypothetical protein BGO67_07115 [Alphaproteobacteria bacterium 41-28]|nr:MAG: hypothetical protein BGO67_07115 [Alphaproteobacteria bacterium 41-28]